MVNILIYLCMAFAVLTWSSLYEKGPREKSIRNVLGEILVVIRTLFRLLTKLISLLVLDLFNSRPKFLKPDPFVSSIQVSNTNITGVITEREYYLYVENLYIQSQNL